MQESNHRNLTEHPTLSSVFLDGVQQLEPQSWSRLVNTFGPIVYRWCRTSGVKESDAPDVVQEVFASVARGIAAFERQKTEGSFRSWLATITRNRVRDHFRRQAQQDLAAGGTDAYERMQSHPDPIDEDAIYGSSIENPLVRRVMESVKLEFEDTTWQAFWMTTIENKSPAFVSQTLSIAVASVYQAKSRVLRKLRQRVSELPA